MKRIVIMILLCVFGTFFSFAQARGSTMYAAVKNLELKSSSGHFASAKGKLEYGEQVTVIQVDGSWVEVRSAPNPSVSGWTSSANLTSRRIVTGNTATTTAKEAALAGKGFNQEMENSYKTDAKLNYAEVDNVEKTQVSDEELKKFITEGRLIPGTNRK